MEAEALVLPDLAAVTQGGVKHATTSVPPDPGDRVVLVGPLSLADVDRAGIELQQHVDLVPRPVSELVDFVGDLQAGSEVLRRGMGGILDHEPHALGPRVAVEVGADELAVLGHLVPGVGGAVYADEAAAARAIVPSRSRNTRAPRRAAADRVARPGGAPVAWRRSRRRTPPSRCCTRGRAGDPASARPLTFP